jgi:hypothetical protein
VSAVSLRERARESNVVGLVAVHRPYECSGVGDRIGRPDRCRILVFARVWVAVAILRVCRNTTTRFANHLRICFAMQHRRLCPVFDDHTQLRRQVTRRNSLYQLRFKR